MAPSGSDPRDKRRHPLDEDERAAAFAEFLRGARERRNLTLQQVSDQTKISSRYLEALEQGNVQTLPPGMYRRAMLRAYAESVGLDLTTALDAFEREQSDPGDRADAAPPDQAPPAMAEMPIFPREAPPQVHARVTPPRRPPRAAILALGVLAAILIWIAVDGIGSDVPPPQPAPPIEQAASPAPAVASPDPPVAVPAAATTAAPLPAVATAPEPPASEPPAIETAAIEPPPPPPAAPPERPRAPVAARTESPPVAPAPAAAAVGPLLVQSEPTGARVTVDGIGWGTTPVTIRNLPPGEKRVRLTMDGYLSHERTVMVGTSEGATTIRATLQRRD